MLTLQNKSPLQTAFCHHRKLNARSHLQDVLTDWRYGYGGSIFTKVLIQQNYLSSADLNEYVGPKQHCILNFLVQVNTLDRHNTPIAIWK